MEAGTTSQGRLVASMRWKRHGKGVFPRTPGRNAALPTTEDFCLPEWPEKKSVLL